MKIKEKSVGLIELFYDLIYVYAVSNLTEIIDHEGKYIPLGVFFEYLIASFVIVQAWLYLTNYINRFGYSTWQEYFLIGVNMIGTLYMTNSINADWTKMYLPFNLSMYIMLISIAGLYFMQFKRTDGGAAIARYAYRVITIVASIYLLIIILAWWLTFPMVMNLDVIAVAAGVVLPIVIKVDFDNKVVSFPHLVERFESLAIIMFGETVVSMADYFELNQFSLIPMVVFLSVMMLFGSYVLQIHYVIEHRQSTRGLVLMYSHFLIVISLNMLTAALTAIREELDSFWLIFIITSLVIFYLPLSANSIYEKERYSLRVSGFLIKGTILIVGGLAWLLMPINLGTATGILLVVTASIFAYDFYQYQHQLRQISE